MPKQKDIPIPKDLKDTQDWFASIITRPIDDENKMEMVSPSGKPMEEEAAKYIAPSPTMAPHSRIELYNQQYWWRLIATMQEIFPLVTRLFGHHGFNNQIAVPYLQKYPSQHWSLIHLGENLARWVEEDYTAKDKKLVYDAVCLDWAFNEAFTKQELPPLNLANLPESGNPDNLITTPLYLQPYLYLFAWNYDLFAFRDTFLSQEPDYWIDNDFPDLPKDKPFFFVLYRDAYQDIRWKEISAAEYHLLVLYQKGSTVEQACIFLENQTDRTIFDEASNNLQNWFQEWTVRGWLSLEKPKKD